MEKLSWIINNKGGVIKEIIDKALDVNYKNLIKNKVKEVTQSGKCK